MVKRSMWRNVQGIRLALGMACTVACAGAAPATQPAAVSPATAQPETAPAPAPAKPQRPARDENFTRMRRQQRQNAHTQYAGIHDGGTVRLEALLRLSIDHGALTFDTIDVPAGEPTRYKVEGSSGVWIVTRTIGPVGPTLTVQYLDPDQQDDDEPWSIVLTCRSPSNFSIYAQSINDQTQLNQFGGWISANRIEWVQGPRAQAVFNVRAANIYKLRAEHPEDFAKYILPLFAKVSNLNFLKPGAADVYGAFHSIPADPAVTQQIEALLPKLDSASFATRSAASAQLDALGAAGVLAALRMDMTSLTAEQRGRLGDFVARHRQRDFEDGASARADANFLTDALDDEDPAVRAAAKTALESLVGKPLAFDLALTGDARHAAVADLRKQIAALPPATQPTTPADAGAAPAPIPARVPLEIIR